MANYEREHFHADTVDEQIDAFQAGQQSIRHSDPLDVQVVHALQNHYTVGNDAREPLERVWNRLAQHRASLNTTSPGVRQQNTAQNDRSNRMRQAFKGSEARNVPVWRLSTIAAVVFAILLVGSLLVVLQQAHQGQKPATGHPTATKQPLVRSDSLYLEVNNTIYRYDVATHKQLWSFVMPIQNGTDPIASNGQVIGNVLYMLGTGNDGYYFYAINTANGTLRWRFKVDYATANLNLLGNPLLADGTVYLSEAENAKGYSIVTALDALTGTTRWQHRYNETGIATRDHLVDAAAGLTLEAATNEVLYGTTYTGRIGAAVTTLYAINTKSGAVLWQKRISTDGEQPDYLSGLVVNGILCITASAVAPPGHRHLYGFDATNGAVRWSVPLDGEVYGLSELNGVVYSDTVQFQTAQDNTTYAASGSVYAVRAVDGTQLWHYPASAGVWSLTVQNGIVSITVSGEDGKSNASIIALDANNGHVRWTDSALPRASIEFSSAPQIVAGTNVLYANYYGDQIQVLRLSDGKVTGNLSVQAPDPSSSSSVGILAVVPAGDSS
ncbi:MAG TPA: PQQ-binding-like beta-propeller repeat protein [Ktedonobacteraceae bacterium]|jgi:outer membrane protein assembly factor BamB|nr:PQQ-binding-like beta-propeller repeat protein [Ktedonobacteraceae bacterium]